MAVEFKTGDVVRLKSGSMDMTIFSVQESIVKTHWFDENTLREGLFHRDSLQLVDRPDDDPDSQLTIQSVAVPEVVNAPAKQLRVRCHHEECRKSFSFALPNDTTEQPKGGYRTTCPHCMKPVAIVMGV